MTTLVPSSSRIVDQEVAPGVENMQLQFGVDVDQDNTVDRYVNPGDAILDPLDAAFIPGGASIDSENLAGRAGYIAGGRYSGPA